jgi:hypothetical protein
MWQRHVGIDAKTRSMMNLSMIGALGEMSEWELHFRGAINNGVSKDWRRPQAVNSPKKAPRDPLRVRFMCTLKLQIRAQQ